MGHCILEADRVATAKGKLSPFDSQRSVFQISSSCFITFGIEVQFDCIPKTGKSLTV